jgi:hypothetical protein
VRWGPRRPRLSIWPPPSLSPTGKRRQSQANLSLSASQDSLAEGASPYASSASLAALGAAGNGGGAAAASVAVPGSSVDGGPFAASAGAAAAAGGPAANGNGAVAAAARAGALPPSGRAPSGDGAAAAAAAAASGDPMAGQGSHIALHWLSRPRNVLVMRKLAASTEGAFQGAVEWLLCVGGGGGGPFEAGPAGWRAPPPTDAPDPLTPS